MGCGLEPVPPLSLEQTLEDEVSVAGYTLRWEGETPIVTSLTMEELEALPEFVMETLNIGATCFYNGLVYGISEEQVLGDNEPMWSMTGGVRLYMKR